VLELAATAILGGFDVAFGIAALVLTEAALAGRVAVEASRVAGAIAFGIGFVFVVVEKSDDAPQ
jgi:formate/nitrite transporter FocA (FNT family)